MKFLRLQKRCSGSNLNTSRYFNSIKNAQLIDIGRCSNMGWFLFKDEKEREISLHIHSPFRLEKSEKIVLASGDMYCPAKAFETVLDFDWDIQGANLFDEKIKKIKSKQGFIVNKVSISKTYDMSISFKNGVLLKTFCDNSNEIEQCRVFLKGLNKVHVVIYPSGYRFE